MANFLARITTNGNEAVYAIQSYAAAADGSTHLDEVTGTPEPSEAVPVRTFVAKPTEYDKLTVETVDGVLVYEAPTDYTGRVNPDEGLRILGSGADHTDTDYVEDDPIIRDADLDN